MMTEPVQIALVASIVPAITAIGVIIVAALGTHRKLEEMKTQLDGRLTQLIEINSAAKKAEGKLEGRAEEAAGIPAAPIATPTPTTPEPKP